MFCRKCGAQISANEKFCTSCGEDLMVVDAETTPVAPVSEKASGKNKGLMAVIIILLIALCVVGAILVYYIYSNQETDTEDAGSPTVVNEEPAENDEPEKTEPAEEYKEEEEKIGKTDNRGKKQQEFLSTAEEISDYEDNAWDTAQSQADFNSVAYNVYTKWDNLLNEVYQYLKTILPEDEFKQLRQDELDWIDRKEAAMDEAGSEWEGGTGETMVYYGEGAEWTRERCYELIYMIE